VLKLGARPLLALGLVCAGFLQPAWSWIVKMTPIHATPLKYSAMLSKSHLGQTNLLTANEAFGARPLQRLLQPQTMASDVFSPALLNKNPSLSGLTRSSLESQLLFRLNKASLTDSKVSPAAVGPHPALRAYYAPAADLARTRSTVAGYAAEAARKDYNESVGATLPAYPVRDSHYSADAKEAAEQLVNRLLLAVLESTDKPGLFSTSGYELSGWVTIVSAEGIRKNLLSALTSSANLGSRPVGVRVWGDLLTQDFPVEIYQPRVRVTLTRDPAVVNYEVDSWLLPSTRTQVHVGVYADNAYASYQRSKETLDRLLMQRQTPSTWFWDANTITFK